MRYIAPDLLVISNPMKASTIIALFCLSLLLTFASAQEPSLELQQQIENELRRMQSPIRQLEWEAEKLASFRALWKGHGTWTALRLVLRTGNPTELELTEEQKERLSSFVYSQDWDGIGDGAHALYVDMYKNPTPEFAQALEAARATLIPDDPLFEHATEEQKNAFREASTTLDSFLYKIMHTEIEETLTPEQMLQVRKLEMQLMPELGMPFPSMFDPLGLTDEQKKEMNRISDELEAEYDHLIREDAALKVERLFAPLESLKEKTFTSREEFQKSLQDARRQVVPSEALRKKQNDLQEQGKKIAVLLRDRLMNVLTDEQLDKMQQIMDDTPEFAKKVLAEIKSGREAQAKSPTYVPGPDSWRPGTPVPTEFKAERKRGRFPRGE
jgi:hypothetical protein